MKKDGYVIVLKALADKSVAATTDHVFGTTVDFYLKQDDAEFVARTAYAGRKLEVRRATIEVHGASEDAFGGGDKVDLRADATCKFRVDCD